MQYIAKTLLYLKDQVEWVNPETGESEQRERGYIHPGQTFDLANDDPRPEGWLALDYVELAPEVEDFNPALIFPLFPDETPE